MNDYVKKNPEIIMIQYQNYTIYPIDLNEMWSNNYMYIQNKMYTE